MIVMKFGGTSVMDASAIERTAQIVKGRLPRRPVVVVSAMSRVTDALLAAGKAAGEGQRELALELAQALRLRHHATVKELVGAAQLGLCRRLRRAPQQPHRRRGLQSARHSLRPC